MSITEAAVEATRRRFRPIVMTSFAFILGVVPLMVATGAGAASQQAIGTVVFGGMMASTLLAIPFVPVFYVALEGMSERLRRAGGPSLHRTASRIRHLARRSPPSKRARLTRVAYAVEGTAPTRLWPCLTFLLASSYCLSPSRRCGRTPSRAWLHANVSLPRECARHRLGR